jgi:alpha-1,2-mannosyltransferase
MVSDRTLRVFLRSDAAVAVAGDLVRVAVGLAVVLLVAFWVVFYAALVRAMVTENHLNDFGKFYYATKAFLSGGDMYGPTIATETVLDSKTTIRLLDMNPPHFHLLILPLARFTPEQALILWGVVGLIALVASIKLIARELGVRWTVAGAIWTLLAVVAFAATGTTIVTGQLTFVILLPMTLAWIAARRNRWTRAGIWLGVAASVKPFLGVFLVWLLLRGRIRAAAAFIGAAGACTVAGLIVFGWRSYAGWLGALSSVTWHWSPMNVSVTGLLARTFSGSAFFRPLVDAPSVVQPLGAAIGFVVAVVSLVILSRGEGEAEVDRGFAGLMLAALLAAPLGSVYYWWFAVGPALALWWSSRRGLSPARYVLLWIALPGLVWPVVFTNLWSDHQWAGLTIGSIYTWSTVSLLTAVLVERSRRTD